MVWNADVRIMDPSNRRASALAWRAGKIVAVGSREEVLLAAGPDPEVWDAEGRTVLPGFVDAHHHPSIVALYGGVAKLARPDVVDIASLLRALRNAAAKLAPGEWLVATDWNETLLAEKRPPTRQELDDAVPDRPLLAMHYSCHRALANSRGLALAGIGRNTPDPPGGLISRGRDREPDGLLIERGISRVEELARGSLVARDVEGFFRRLAAHYEGLLSTGITRVADCTVPGDILPLYREAARRGLVKVPTVMFPVSAHGYFEEPWDALEGPVTGTVDGPLTVGPVKLVFDGAPTCALCISWLQSAGLTLRTLALSLETRSIQPIRTMMSSKPRMGLQLRTGIKLYERDRAELVVRSVVDRGFSVAVHAIGNEAVDGALGAFEHAGSALHRAGPPRIEHAMFLSRELVSRIADRGAIVVAQPHMLELPDLSVAPSIPGLRMFPMRWLLDAGVRVAGSSDFPVADYAPLRGIRSAVTRHTLRGTTHEADQCVGLDEALAAYTRVAAEACGAGAQCGTLETGKRADIVVTDRSLYAQDIEHASIRATIVGGEVLHGGLA